MSMNKEAIHKRIIELSTLIEEHNYNYYVKSNPIISDYEFDTLLKELEKLEKDFPEFALENSPTKRVGGDITKKFPWNVLTTIPYIP